MNIPLVEILMGSDSDLSVMKDAAEVLEKEFGILSEVHTLSAHRTPDAVVGYVKKAEADGYKLFICGAGGAAHLAGVVAAHTSLPVIGVPIQNRPGQGMGALFFGWRSEGASADCPALASSRSNTYSLGYRLSASTGTPPSA